MNLLIAGLIDVLPTVDTDLKKIAARVLGKAKEVCASKSVSSLHFCLSSLTLFTVSLILDFS